MTDHIKNYWERQGQDHGDSHWASWGDNWMIDLEIETIGQFLYEGASVIDIGCANGYSTFRQYDERRPSSIVGIDFAESMVDEALKVKKQKYQDAEISFGVGDIRKLHFDNNQFDIAYTTRVLINLATWEEQQSAITECLRIVKPGGKVVLSEGFWEPLCLLNAMRLLNGMPPLVEHDFNRYLKQEKLELFLRGKKVEYEIVDFSSIYYLGSRFLREIVTDTSKYEGFTNPINKIFYELEKQYSGGGFGIQQVVVIKK